MVYVHWLDKKCVLTQLLMLTPAPQMFMVPSSGWDLPSVVYTLLTVIHNCLVIIMSISALRLYRGLVDSAVVNRGCYMVVEADGAIKRPTVVSVNSDIQFAIPISTRKQDDGLGSLESGTV
jgi:hypothetical protein